MARTVRMRRYEVTEMCALIEISNQDARGQRLRSRRPSLRKTGLAVAINEMLKRSSVAASRNGSVVAQWRVLKCGRRKVKASLAAMAVSVVGALGQRRYWVRA